VQGVSTLGRRVLLWMIPLNLVLIAWVWGGRMLFGVGGWFLLIYLVSAVPLLRVGLGITTVLAFTQPGRPRSVTRRQAVAQLAVWGGMFGFGAFSVDVGDDLNSETSLLTQLFGYSDAALEVSWAVTMVFGAATVVAWVALVVTLTAGRRRQDAPDEVTAAR